MFINLLEYTNNISIREKDCEVKRVKLEWIEFENWKTELKIERIDFNLDVTLLVGLSGVGKTQILNAIEYSLKMAVDKSIQLRPYNASLCFSIGQDVYKWSYRIKQIKEEEIIETKEKQYIFAYEKMQKNGEDIFVRENDKVKIRGYDKVPSPKRDESLLLQYAQDVSLRPIIADIMKLYPIEIDMDVLGVVDKDSFNQFKVKIQEIMQKNPNQKFSIFSHLPVALKLYITKKYYPEMYTKIFDAVKELFIEITDLDIVEDVERDICLVAIRVYDKVLMQGEISNGMLKTIYYIIELITMSSDSLVLIDEFENGLGVNCIDVLAELLLNERTDLQFIITSHHPKIINQISSRKWKIIDRDINVVKNSVSDEYGIGNSQHDAYFNLINRWEFEGKI